MWLRNWYRFPEEIYLYIEKYCPYEHTVLADFMDSNEATSFNAYTSLNYDWEHRPTMILFHNYHLKPLREGSYYRVSKETCMKLIDLDLIQIQENSLLIGMIVNMDERIDELFEKTKTFNEEERFLLNIDQSTMMPQNIELDFNHISRVIVRNIGQGSWNEIKKEQQTSLVFDAGTIYTTSKIAIIEKTKERDAVYQKNNPALIISHWDVDHYHYLLGFTDATISSFRCFIHRGIIPNLTARKVIGRFLSLNKNQRISLEPKQVKKGAMNWVFTDNYPLIKSKGVVLFNGATNPDRNKSGMGLLVRTKKRSIILPADLHYIQVSTNILPQINYPNEHYLVVPHHGGRAGKFIYRILRKDIILKDAIVSVGKNPYRPQHPIRQNMNDLISIGFNTVRTDMIKEDYVIEL